MDAIVPRLSVELAPGTTCSGLSTSRGQCSLRLLMRLIATDTPFVLSRGSSALYQLAMAPVLLPSKVEMPIAFSAEASNAFPPSASVDFGEPVGVAVRLARVVSVSADVSLEVETAVTALEKVDAGFVASIELSSSTTLVVSAWSMVTVGPVFAADTCTPNGPVIGVEKIK